MSTDSEASIERLEGALRMSRLLAKSRLIIYRCQFDYLAFGSWSIEAGTAHRRFQINYDGKQGEARYSSASLKSQSTPPRWEDRGGVPVDMSDPRTIEAWVDSLLEEPKS